MDGVLIVGVDDDKSAKATLLAAGERAGEEHGAFIGQLAGRFLTDFYVMVAQWVDSASELVDTWPDDVRDAPFDISVAEEGVRLAERVQKVKR